MFKLCEAHHNLIIGRSRTKQLEAPLGRKNICDIKPGERIDDEVFLIRSKDRRTTNNGGLYIHAVLVDKTGQLVARAWQASEDMFHGMPEGGFLRFKGRAENYKGNLQF